MRTSNATEDDVVAVLFLGANLAQVFSYDVLLHQVGAALDSLLDEEPGKELYPRLRLVLPHKFGERTGRGIRSCLQLRLNHKLPTS
jgi:hypothetical protein